MDKITDYEDAQWGRFRLNSELLNRQTWLELTKDVLIVSMHKEDKYFYCTALSTKFTEEWGCYTFYLDTDGFGHWELRYEI